jgi:hypothetical protein
MEWKRHDAPTVMTAAPSTAIAATISVDKTTSGSLTDGNFRTKCARKQRTKSGTPKPQLNLKPDGRRRSQDRHVTPEKHREIRTVQHEANQPRKQHANPRAQRRGIPLVSYKFSRQSKDTGKNQGKTTGKRGHSIFGNDGCPLTLERALQHLTKLFPFKRLANTPSKTTFPANSK